MFTLALFFMLHCQSYTDITIFKFILHSRDVKLKIIQKTITLFKLQKLIGQIIIVTNFLKNIVT